MKLARTTTGKYVVEAVAKALDVLESFTGSDGIALSQISRQIGLNKSRTFRLLYTLAERGYVQRSADGARYRLGIRLFERAAAVRRDIRVLARPLMLGLQERFQEMVNLGVMDNGYVLYLDIVESSRPFRMSASVGCRMIAYRTSMGKAILAYREVAEPRSAAVALGKVSRQKLPQLRQELQLIRERGYALDNQENERGVACVGAPVLDATGRPLAAISVSGPVQRILANEKKIAEALVAVCRDISRKLADAQAAVNRRDERQGTKAASA